MSLPPLPDASKGGYEVNGATGRPRAVKLLDHVHWNDARSLPAVPWRFIWCERNTRQQATSMVKFLATLAPQIFQPANQQARFRESFERSQAGVIRGLQDVGPVLRVKFERVLADPVEEARRLCEFLDLDDVLAASSVVLRRPPECAPDLAIELETGQLRREAAAS